jgi:hypothetical protein
VVTWLPPEVGPRELTELDWWRPTAVADWLGDDALWRTVAYLVVDELEDGTAGLVVSPWPRLDERGRLHFGDEDDSDSVSVSEDAFLALLAEKRRPIVQIQLDDSSEEELRTRKLAIGDVFAARIRRGGPGRGGGGGGPDGGAPVDPHTWLRDEVLDITAEAREVAKAQAAAAVAGVVDDEFLEAVGEEIEEEEEGPPTTTPDGTGSPTPAGGGSAGGAAADVPAEAAPPARAEAEADEGQPVAKQAKEGHSGTEAEMATSDDIEELLREMMKPLRKQQREDEDEGRLMGA